jgi:hypothetical protein
VLGPGLPLGRAGSIYAIPLSQTLFRSFTLKNNDIRAKFVEININLQLLKIITLELKSHLNSFSDIKAKHSQLSLL